MHINTMLTSTSAVEVWLSHSAFAITLNGRRHSPCGEQSAQASEKLRGGLVVPSESADSPASSVARSSLPALWPWPRRTESEEVSSLPSAPRASVEREELCVRAEQEDRAEVAVLLSSFICARVSEYSRKMTARKRLITKKPTTMMIRTKYIHTQGLNAAMREYMDVAQKSQVIDWKKVMKKMATESNEVSPSFGSLSK